MEKATLSTANVFRIAAGDKKALEQVSARLGLNESETARRAMRLGLRVLSEADFPG